MFGGKPITVALPSLVDGDGEVTIDEADSVYLVDDVSDGAGSFVPRQTLLLQIPGDGRPTCAGIAAGRDEVLERALQVLKQ